MKGIAVLGATGSIGVNTLDVIARHPDRYRVVALGAHRNVEGLYKQIVQFRPRLAALTDPVAAQALAAQVKAAGLPTEVLSGAAVIGTDKAIELFESAYDEHARRLAKLYANIGNGAPK